MAPQSVFGEAIDILKRNPGPAETTQAVQTLHHLMTGGPAESPEGARAAVKSLCETVIECLATFEAPPAESTAPVERAAAEEPGLQVHREARPPREP